MDDAFTGMGRIGLSIKDYIWRQNENGSMRIRRKKEAAPCSLNGADTASFKLEQNYFLTQFILQTPANNNFLTEIFFLCYCFLQNRKSLPGVHKRHILLFY